MVTSFVYKHPHWDRYSGGKKDKKLSTDSYIEKKNNKFLCKTKHNKIKHTLHNNNTLLQSFTRPCYLYFVETR